MPATTAPTDPPGWRDSSLSATGTHRSTDARDSAASASPPPAPRTPRDNANFTSDAPAVPTTPKGPVKSPPANGSFKVVIDRANNDESVGAQQQLYEVPIPHYRLGTPHFTGMGSAVLHSSIHTGSSALNSERASVEATAASTVDQPAIAHQLATRTPARMRSSSHASSEPPGLTPDRVINPDVLFTKDPQKTAIGTADVRVSPVSGQILAASIPQLIVHITSPYRLDYDLLSDFFLTFRLFMAPADLAVQLLHRLRASVGSGDGMSRIVRVRTFVALRHWILNYFVDDFVSDLRLRVEFCEMVNSLCRDVREVNSQTVGDLRILGELKRCWKHTCALFWDVPMDVSADHMEQDIFPGGTLGSRAVPPEQSNTAAMQTDTGSRESSPAPPSSVAESYSPTRLSTRGSQRAPNFAFNQTSALQSTTSLSRSSRKPPRVDRHHSMQVLSCTLPTQGRLSRQPSQGPRPVGSLRSHSGRTQHSNEGPRRNTKRSGSFSDALRDDRLPLSTPQVSESGQAQPLQMIVPGSLIRGALLSPAMPYVECVETYTPLPPPLEQRTPSRKSDEDAVTELSAERQGNHYTPNVRRFIGNVRRALSVKNYTARPLSNTLDDRNKSCSSLASHGPFMAAPLAQKGVPRRKLIAGQTRLRVDLLAADIATAFNDAVQEATDAQLQSEEDEFGADRQSNASYFLRLPSVQNKINSNVTMGSRSIIIADDTNGQITPRPDVTTFAQKYEEKFPSGQDVPVFLDGEPNPDEVFLDADGNIIDPELVRSPHGTEPRASQLSGANNLHDVTAVSLQEREKYPEDSLDDTVSYTDTTSTSDPFHYDRAPLGQLRRMPGGNLKTAHHVHSLDHTGPFIPPRHSSANATRVLEQADEDEDPDSPGPHHPSFENEVAKLADLSDSSEEEEEGGIASALRKLEGREALPPKKKKSPTAQATTPRMERGRQPHRPESDELLEIPDLDQTPRPPRSATTNHIGNAISTDSTASDVTDTSIPLLERGISYQPNKRTQTVPDVDTEDESHDKVNGNGKIDNSHEVLELQRRARAAMENEENHRSFLLDDDQSLSNLSSTEPDDASDFPPSAGMRSFFEAEDEDGSDGSNASTASGLNEGRGPLSSPPPEERPENPLGRSTPSDANHERSLSENDQPLAAAHMRSKSLDDLIKYLEYPYPTTSRTPEASHLCFILAYDSRVLAEQFTVIERDALCEVEWRDLIDLRWNQAAAAHSNWVDFLRSKGTDNGFDQRAGVDMCIARFNLVVRWVKSEVVLTEDVAERAATVAKYIHVAVHCRRLRNWATMYQITMALVGSDISRLRHTWNLVPPRDRKLLAELEELIMPTKNFFNLREEIDSATEAFGQDGDGGCIPFIGIYTHDLIYNAQKPLDVPSGAAPSTTPSGYPPETLVNFERHHTAATIVKNLLRLIEASSKYQFQPLPELAARCLWIGALSDEEVSHKSLDVEPVITRIVV